MRYNGKEQSVTGFTYTAPEGVTVALRDSKAEAKGTDKGTYYMGLTKGDFTVSSKIYKEFEIIVNGGYLEDRQKRWSSSPSQAHCGDRRR